LTDTLPPLGKGTSRRDNKISTGIGEFRNVYYQWIDDGETAGPIDTIEIEGRDLKTLIIYKDGVADRPREFRSYFQRLSEPRTETRLMIFAHGNRGSTSVGGRSPQQVAKLLADCGLKSGSERLRVSLVACCAGSTVHDVYGE
jgi:hypothetical protein